MNQSRMPKPGEIYNHFKDKPYQIITVATHSETLELMVVYQALYGEFKTYVRPLEMFISEVDAVKYPDVKQKYRFELRRTQEGIAATEITELNSEQLKKTTGLNVLEQANQISSDDVEESVNTILLKFLDADSYTQKLDVLTSNMKHMSDRLINDMAVSLDCTIDEGPLDQRIQALTFSLQSLCRFEDRRLR